MAEYSPLHDCLDTFASMKCAREHHKDIHARESRYICIVCDRSFATEEYLELHRLSLHMLPKKANRSGKKLKWQVIEPNIHGNFPCLECPKWFFHLRSVKDHFFHDHTSKKKSVCKVCKKSFLFEDYMKLHLKAAHMLPKIQIKGSLRQFEWKIAVPNKDGRIQCLDCSKTFLEIHSAKRHYEEVHKTKDKLVCQICKKRFQSEDYVKLHLQASHILPKRISDGSGETFEWKIVKPNSDGRISCFDCSKTFANIHTAKIHHELVHKTNDKFACQVCKKRFQTEEYMKLHLKAAHMLSDKVRVPVNLINTSMKTGGQFYLIRLMK